MTSGPAREGRPALSYRVRWLLPIGGAGVFPQSGAGGQVTTEPSFMPAIAASILVWMSAGSLLAAS